MAVNNGTLDRLKTNNQSNSSNGHEDGGSLQRTRTASPDNGRSSPTIFNPFFTGRPRTPANGSKPNPIDRQEIIRRIKSGGSRPTSPELERSPGTERQEIYRQSKSQDLDAALSGENRSLVDGYNRKRKSPSPPTTPVTSNFRPQSPEIQEDNQSIGLQIERPRSALHRGDFRETEHTKNTFDDYRASSVEQSIPSLSTSPVAPWHPEFPAAASRQLPGTEIPFLAPSRLSIPARPVARERGISNASLASTFVYKPPTSPLVQSSRPDTPEPLNRQRSKSPDKSRRHTFSPHSFQFPPALDYPGRARGPARPIPTLRAEKSFPYQAHQPRRSLNSTSFSSLPQTPVPATNRRPSLSGDSPLHDAPMVGSYEESILRGRMSTAPSRPLNFMAQIGVLGKGKCKSSLRCPPHVSLPFPAVFYSYGSGSKGPEINQPSPYVGLIDLENSLSNQEDSQSQRRQRMHDPRSNQGSRATSPRPANEDGLVTDAQARRRKRQKDKRRSGSPKAPPGGSYRIPQQGQLQIVIKNPNKTAVKLFLVPYDLSDMEPGQKTFIRQRSYSAGPIIDMPLSSRKNLGTDRPEAALSATDDPNDRPMLRYLIHVHICCPSKGRYFLYKSIRVVFANRVPDGKENLRNEIQLPEPRYSTYKASRDSNAHNSALAQEKSEVRRRSAIEQNEVADPRWPLKSFHLAQSLPSNDYTMQHDIPTQPLPHLLTVLPTLDSRPSSRHMSDAMDDCISPSTSIRSPMSVESDTPQYGVPRLQDPFQFARDSSLERRPKSRNESLLSRRLMDLAFKRQSNGHESPRDDL